MWSKTRQILESKIADKLQGRISYHYDVYRTKKHKDKPDWHTEMHVFSIIVDGDAWFCTNPRFYSSLHRSNGKTEEEVIRETGFVGCEWGYNAPQYIGKFLSMSINEAFTHENYFIRLLALLDKRVGKRRLTQLVTSIDNEPEWFRKWILLRCEAEGVRKKVEKKNV